MSDQVRDGALPTETPDLAVASNEKTPSSLESQDATTQAPHQFNEQTNYVTKSKVITVRFSAPLSN